MKGSEWRTHDAGAVATLPASAAIIHASWAVACVCMGKHGHEKKGDGGGELHFDSG